jgi:DNA-binding response OmpR family regulator
MSATNLSSEPSPLPEPRARLLVVDDDPQIREAVRRAAEAAGMEVVEASDGRCALALATTERFDAIVLDVLLPALDGRDLLEKLRRSDLPSATVPVLVYSGRGTQHDRLLALELGADDFVDKPMPATLLLRKVERMMEKATESAAEARVQ